MPKRTVLYFFLTAAAGVLASLFTVRAGERLALLKQPLFFPPVWLTLLGWAAVLIILAVVSSKTEESRAAMAFYVSLGLMAGWAVLFFRTELFLAAAVCGLLHTGVWLHLRRLLSEAGKQKVLIACCCWSGYMVYLNLGVWLIN
ncbi:MAG: tryptophan-rich sensory protein [Oscillospiraceae bacterium]|nr:tryptophan-rich sensory protein [Oscillospiraceae bacterium]